MLTASASGLYLFGAQCPTPPILYLRFTASLTVAAQDSRPSGSLLLSCKASSSSASCRFSGSAMARTGLRMVPTFPSSPLKFRTVGFPQYGFKAGLSKGACPVRGAQLSRPSGLHPSFVLPAFRPVDIPALCRGGCALEHRHKGRPAPLPQGPSLRSGFCCPGPSSLNRPHPPHSRAHPHFTDLRLIGDAWAVPIRIGLGHPRLVLSFH